MTTPTPSAPTAEMLAQEAKRLARAVRLKLTAQCISPCAKNARACDDADKALDAAIDRLAALARSEPPTGEPVLWWNGLYDDPTDESSICSVSREENTWHDIPLTYAEARAPVAIPDSRYCRPEENFRFDGFRLRCKGCAWAPDMHSGHRAYNATCSLLPAFEAYQA